jgi:hypothetical protein
MTAFLGCRLATIWAMGDITADMLVAFLIPIWLFSIVIFQGAVANTTLEGSQCAEGGLNILIGDFLRGRLRYG